MSKEKETYEQWISRLETLSFEDRAIELKNKILESPELADESRRYFNDCFNYVMEQYKYNKPLSTSLMKIHLVDIKGYKQLTVQELSRIMIMLGLCGFSFDYSE